MKNFLLIAEVILAITIIVSILMQPSKADALSGLVQGSKNETFFQKNKGKTKEAMLAKVTLVSAGLFAIVTIALNMVK